MKLELFKEVLNSLEKELDFYRKKMDWIISNSLILNATIITGKLTIQTNSVIISKVLYIFLLIIILAFSIILSLQYSNRIFILRNNRQKLLNEFGFEELFPKVDKKNKIDKIFRPSNLYLILLTSLSLVAMGIILIS